MATNPPEGDGHRNGAVRKRSQFKHPNGHWIKRDKRTGQIVNVKSDKRRFKGITRER